MQLVHKQERSKTEMRYPEICLKAYPTTSESNKVLDSYMTMWNQISDDTHLDSTLYIKFFILEGCKGV